MLDLDFGNPQTHHQPPPPTRTAASGQLDPWGMPQSTQQPLATANTDPWGGSRSAGMALGGASVGETSVAAGLPTNSDPWSPVQNIFPEHPPAHLPSAATGAIPRTSPAMMLEKPGGVGAGDSHRIPASKFYETLYSSSKWRSPTGSRE